MPFKQLKILLGSTVVGLLLGALGAAAAHFFGTGIQILEQLSLDYLPFNKKFIILFCTLSLAAILITTVKNLLGIKSWHGPADTIFAAHRVDNELDVKTGISSTIVAFISAAGGASVGQYGPLVHFGATLGAFMKSLFKLKISTDIVLGGGVAAAISAGFSAPLAGILFAHEAILRHMSVKALAPIALASGTAYGINSFLWESSPLLPQTYSNISLLPMILVSLVVGPFFGLVSIVFMQSVLRFSWLSEKLDVSKGLSFGIAILGLSAIGSIFPEVMGLGTQSIIDLASENKLFLAAVGILFAKIIATSLSIGFGFYGGVFSPALLVGAAAGSAITAIVNHTGLYEFAGPELVICGMAAVAGAVVGAPLSMIIIVLELTGSYSLALTSTVGIATATVISGQLFGNSIFDKQLKQRKINISQGRLGLRLMEEEIKSIINSSALKFDSRTKASVALQTLIKEHQTEAYVVSDDNQYIGKLHLGSLFNAKNSDLVTTVIDHTAITIKSDASLQQAIEAAANFIGEAIPVVETESRNFLGTINEGDIFKLYLTLQGQTIDLEKR